MTPKPATVRTPGRHWFPENPWDDEPSREDLRDDLREAAKLIARLTERLDRAARSDVTAGWLITEAERFLESLATQGVRP